MDMLQGKHAWIVKLGEKGQFVIPKEARDEYGLQPGQSILVLGDDEKGLAIPTKAQAEQYFAHIFKEMGEDL